MRIVKIGNKYAVEKRLFFFFKVYLDLNPVCGGYWWLKEDEYFSECLGTRKQCFKAIKKYVPNSSKVLNKAINKMLKEKEGKQEYEEFISKIKDEAIKNGNRLYEIKIK